MDCAGPPSDPISISGSGASWTAGGVGLSLLTHVVTARRVLDSSDAEASDVPGQLRPRMAGKRSLDLDGSSRRWIDGDSTEDFAGREDAAAAAAASGSCSFGRLHRASSVPIGVGGFYAAAEHHDHRPSRAQTLRNMEEAFISQISLRKNFHLPPASPAKAASIVSESSSHSLELFDQNDSKIWAAQLQSLADWEIEDSGYGDVDEMDEMGYESTPPPASPPNAVVPGPLHSQEPGTQPLADAAPRCAGPAEGAAC